MQEAAHPPARVPSRVADAPCLRCLHGGGLEQVRQWRRKRVLMRPEAAFPYVFAAEGAQHPPNKPPRSTVSRNGCRQNKPPRQTSRHAQRFAKQAAPLNAPPQSTRKPVSTSLKAGNLYAFLIFLVICHPKLDEKLLLQGNTDDFAYFCLERELWKNCFIHYSASVLSCA